MNKTIISNIIIFEKLFTAVCEKLFGLDFARVLSESESKQLSYKIEESTGLVIGWKSLKNYSSAIWDKKSGRKANPSSATLDTLSRYVLNAPYISEPDRKNSEEVYIYWFKFRKDFLEQQIKKVPSEKKKSFPLLLPLTVIFAVVLIFFFFFRLNDSSIEEDFQCVDQDILIDHNWKVLNKDTEYWEKRGTFEGKLTLFTQTGDSWPNDYYPSAIKNVVYRDIYSNNFSTEIHFSEFVPTANWQQAGIILLEDTLFQKKHMRMTIVYNDILGDANGNSYGDSLILAQVVASEGNNTLNVEEVVNIPMFSFVDTPQKDIETQLICSALKIEKKDNKFRFLLANSLYTNFSYREIGTYEFNMEVKYVGIFAMKGFFADETPIMPVKIEYFGLKEL